MILFRAALHVEHKSILSIAKTSKYTKDFGAIMFSSPEAYQKGWIRVAMQPGDDIVGFTCVRHKTRAPETVLYFINVRPELRCAGIGEELMYDLECVSPHRRIALNVAKENTRGLEFYLHLGYKTVGEAIEGTAWHMEKTW